MSAATRTDPLLGLSMRVPPSNLEAEQALLGALLANAKAYDQVAEFLRPEHFADGVHAAIYAAIQRRINAGSVADAVTLRAEFENSGVLDEAGGVAYLGQLLTAMVGIINAGAYGKAILDCWLRRQMIDLGEVIINRAFGADAALDARGIAEEADRALLMLSMRPGGSSARQGHQVANSVMEEIAAAIDRGGMLTGIPWGFRGLDRMTGGLRPGQFVLIGARPSMGKTSVGLRIAINAGHAGKRVLFISAEMAAEEIVKRALSVEARVPLSVVTSARIDDDREPDGFRPLRHDSPEMQRLAEASKVIGALPIIWDDGAKTAAAVRAVARRMLREPGGLDLIVVDYLGMMRASAEAKRSGNRVMEVRELSQDFKEIAMQLRVPVVMLSQLSRASEGREDKLPQLSDLRDSGDLEQDADVVVFIHRDHYYLMRNPPKRRGNETAIKFAERSQQWREDCEKEQGRATLFVAKQRQGRIGPVRVRFDDATTHFHDDHYGQGGD